MDERSAGNRGFVDDRLDAGCLHGAVVRSTVNRGTLAAVRLDPSEDWSDVTMVTASDLPGAPRLVFQESEQPLLAGRRALHRHEPVVLIACRDPERLARLRRRVELEYRTRIPVEDIHGALDSSIRIFGADNVAAEWRWSEGDHGCRPGDGRRQVRIVTTLPEHEPLSPEPARVLVRHTPRGGVLATGPFPEEREVRRHLASALDLSPDLVEIEVTTRGRQAALRGNFLALTAVHAALLARASGEAVALRLSRFEDMAAGPKRPASEVVAGAVLDAADRLVAIEIDAVFDGGAYPQGTQALLAAALHQTRGAYGSPGIVFRGRVVATNSPPQGCSAAAGAFAVNLALERLIDAVAMQTGRDPLSCRGEWIGDPGIRSRFESLAAAVPGAGPGRGAALALHAGVSTAPPETPRLRVARAGRRGTGPQVHLAMPLTEVGAGGRKRLVEHLAQALGLPHSSVLLTGVLESEAEDRRSEAAVRALDALLAALEGGEEESRLAPPAPPGRRRSPGAAAVAVEVDALTSRVRPLACALDQVGGDEGLPARRRAASAAAEAIAYATTEEVVVEYGGMANARFESYAAVRAGDLPEILVRAAEAEGCAEGAGAVAAALLAAVERATGLVFHELPLTPETVAERAGEGRR